MAGASRHMLVIGGAGFILASALLLVLVAKGFGSRQPARDTLIALVLAASVFFIFTRGLGLKLPSGPFGAMF